MSQLGWKHFINMAAMNLMVNLLERTSLFRYSQLCQIRSFPEMFGFVCNMFFFCNYLETGLYI